MDTDKLIRLINKIEGPKLDFKMKLNLDLQSHRKEFAKDVIAMANSIGGRGYLIIGIEDKTKRIVGVDPDDFKEERLQQIISSRSIPPVRIRVEYHTLDEKTIVVVTIFSSYKKPFQALPEGAFYIRRGSTTDIARIDEIASMLQRSGIITNEQIPLLDVSIDNLDKKLINSYLYKINLDGNSDNLSLLNDLGIIHYVSEINEYRVTIGGLLLFSNHPQIFLPYSGVKVILEDCSSTSTYMLRGPLLIIIDEFKKLLEEKTKYKNKQVIEEALNNAIIHRDYFDSSRNIVVYLSKEQVEIINPGTLYGNTNVDNLMNEKNPKRRNIWLYDRLIILDDANRFIRKKPGLEFIKNGLKSIGNVKFINVPKKNLFKVIITGNLTHDNKDQ